VVTGTFLRGTPATAVVPVEGTNLEELRDRGSPSNMDFVKGLSEIGSVAGEANRLNAFAIGAASINLRNLSSSRTVVVFNGRRFPEQYSFSVGRFNNIAQIPNAAIGRVEVLKDGGATTYGADAVGGVVNYITRRNLDGVEISANYRYIKDSAGDYDASISLGKVEDKWNVMGVLGYIKRSELDLKDRSWALRPYLMNPSSWNSGGQPGAFAFQINTTGASQGTASTTATISGYSTISLLANATSNNVFGTTTPFALRYTGNRQISATGIMRDPACNAVGGFAGWSTTPSPVCYFQFNWLSNLVEEQETWQGYAEANYEFSPKFKLHGEFTYYGLDIPRIPIDNGGALVNSFPLNRTNDTPTGAFLFTGGTVASQGSYFVSGFNPAVANIMGDLKNSDGTNAFTAGQIAAIQASTTIGGATMAAGRVSLPLAAWRPFGYGGNPIYGETDFQHNQSQQYRYTLDFSGDIGKLLGGTWDWDFAITHNTLNYKLAATDMLVDRLQSALNGFGGAACNGIRAGTSGSTCEYFNPFSSAMAKNIFTGATNPFYVGSGTFPGYMPGKGLQNDPDLIRWMYVPVSMTRTSTYDIFDAVLRGDLDYHLWSKDPIQIAVGGQYRELHEISDLSDYGDEFNNPCSTPGFQLCASTARTSALVFRRGVQISGFTRDYDRRYPVGAAFAEVKVPITDKLNAQVSTRWEKFYSDLGAQNNEVVVAQGALRYQALPWLAFRATAGQTFTQVNPPAPNIPSATLNTQLPQAQGGVLPYTSENWANTGVKPETGFNYNIGAIFQVGDVTATVDYYNIKIENLARASSSAQILTAATVQGTTGVAALVNCSSPLLTQSNPLFNGLPFLVGGSAAGASYNLTTGAFTQASCVQGQTTFQQFMAGGDGLVNFYGSQGQQTALVNGGTLETSGLDFNVNWRRADVLGGDLTLGADGTYVLTYKQGDYTLNGILIAPGYDNGIGLLNNGTGHNGQRVAQFRGSVNANFRLGRHNFNWRTNMISSEINDSDTAFLPSNTLNANIPGANGIVGVSGTCNGQQQSPPVPSAAGTGAFGTFATSGALGFDPCQNYIVTSAQKIPASFNSDFTYRITLPAQTSLSLSIQNVFDTDPKFSRDAINYDAFSGSPLGRTYRLGVTKKW
ncbi:MAG TPA: TonB-dependent receptor, partial [Caulobacteraceae bacterium]|nr:TonB-dependent receptor [Caulobacteraceae bacterium]